MKKYIIGFILGCILSIFCCFFIACEMVNIETEKYMKFIREQQELVIKLDKEIKASRKELIESYRRY